MTYVTVLAENLFRDLGQAVPFPPIAHSKHQRTCFQRKAAKPSTEELLGLFELSLQTLQIRYQHRLGVKAD